MIFRAMDEKKVNGVFLHSQNLESEFMFKCLQMLLSIFPEVKITSVASDERHLGYRVHFLSPKEDEVLAWEHLIVSGIKMRIAPLRTYLTIHDVRKNGGAQYEDELRETIRNKFGELLDVVPVPNLGSKITRNLRVHVDVPELEELEVFNRHGYAHMFVRLPSNKEILKVTFYCRRCMNDGHVQKNCPNVTQPGEVLSLPGNRRSVTSESKKKDDETNPREDFKFSSTRPEFTSSPAHNRAGPSSATPTIPAAVFDRLNDLVRSELGYCLTINRNSFRIARKHTRSDAEAAKIKRRIQRTAGALNGEDTRFDKLSMHDGLVMRFNKAVKQSLTEPMSDPSSSGEMEGPLKEASITVKVSNDTMSKTVRISTMSPRSPPSEAKNSERAPDSPMSVDSSSRMSVDSYQSRISDKSMMSVDT